MSDSASWNDIMQRLPASPPTLPGMELFSTIDSTKKIGWKRPDAAMERVSYTGMQIGEETPFDDMEPHLDINLEGFCRPEIHLKKSLLPEDSLASPITTPTATTTIGPLGGSGRSSASASPSRSLLPRFGMRFGAGRPKRTRCDIEDNDDLGVEQAAQAVRKAALAYKAELEASRHHGDGFRSQKEKKRARLQFFPLGSEAQVLGGL